MYLRDYLDKHHILIKEFAELIGICPAYLSCIMHGKRPISKKVARNIIFATEGEVMIEEIVAPQFHGRFEGIGSKDILFAPEVAMR